MFSPIFDVLELGSFLIGWTWSHNFFVVLDLGLRCTAFAKSLALALDGFDLYSVHMLIRAKIWTQGRWLRSKNAIRCATRPPGLITWKSQKIASIWTNSKLCLTIFILSPKMSPKMAPRLQKRIECHSILIRIHRMVNEAQVMPRNKRLELWFID